HHEGRDKGVRAVAEPELNARSGVPLAQGNTVGGDLVEVQVGGPAPGITNQAQVNPLTEAAIDESPALDFAGLQFDHRQNDTVDRREPARTIPGTWAEVTASFFDHA